MQVKKNMQVKTDVTNVVTPHMWRDLDVQLVDINARAATYLVMLVVYVSRKKKESQYKRDSRQPRAHQLMVGRASVQDSLCDQSDKSSCSSDESFCFQMKVKSTETETKLQEPRHLVTNLAYKLKPQKKIKYLRARIDTWAEANILPLSV